MKEWNDKMGKCASVRALTAAACLVLAAAFLAAPLRAGDQSDKPAHFDDSKYTSGLPTHRDVAYGEHFRQRLDVWIPDGVGAAERLPCIVVIHGGAWVDGDRVKDSAGMVVRGRRDRLVIVSISYRMVPGCQRAGIVPPLSGPLDDAVAAVAFVKAHAGEWHIDEKRIGLAGGSAGACSSLYAAFQGDCALGVKAIQIGIAQTTLDPDEVVAWVPGGWYGGHGFGYGYTDIKSFRADRAKWLPWIRKYSPAELLRGCTAAKAPKVFYSTRSLAPYGSPEVQPQHSGYYMIAFSRLCREKGVFCERGDAEDFIAALKSDLRDDPCDFVRARLAAGERNVRLPRGVYAVEPRDADRRVYLRLKGLKDVAIDFGGSRFLCREKTRFLDLVGCTNVTVRNFTVDYDPLPFTQAIIEKIDADRNWDVRIVPGYPRPTEAELAAGVWPVQAYAKEDLELKNPNRYRDGIRVVKTGEDTYRVTGGVDRTGDVGDVCVWSIAATGPSLKSVIASERCTGCRYENVTAYSTPGGCICAEMYCHGATYRRCRLVRCPVDKDASPRAMKRVRSGNHDAFNARFGDTVTFDGCEAAYHCDDSINISGYYSVVVKSEGPRIRVFPAFGRGGLFAPGDTVQIMTYDGRVPPDAKVLKVEKAEPPTDDERKRVLATRLREPCLNAVKSALTLTLDRDADFGFGDVVIANERMGNGFAIRNCRLGSTRARAMLIKASDGIIENNFIERSHYDAISIYPEYEWLEGGCSRNVTIRGNVIRNSGGGISVGGKSGNGTRLPKEAHAGIVIGENDIK